MHPVVQGLQSLGDKVANEVDASERRGSLTDEAARLLREAGVVRMLQPKDYGGDEAHPREFYEALMELAARPPSAGSAAWWGCIPSSSPRRIAACRRRSGVRIKTPGSPRPMPLSAGQSGWMAALC